MLKVVERYFRAGDDRGSIEGLVAFGEWRELNLVVTSAGTTRGNHFHLDTRELFVLLDGDVRVVAQRVEGGQLVGDPFEHHFRAGDVFLVEPGVNHTFHVLSDARWINALSQRMSPSNPDIHRVA